MLLTSNIDGLYKKYTGNLKKKLKRGLINSTGSEKEKLASVPVFIKILSEHILFKEKDLSCTNFLS